MAGCEIQTIQCRCLMWVGDLEIAYYINIFKDFFALSSTQISKSPTHAIHHLTYIWDKFVMSLGRTKAPLHVSRRNTLISKPLARGPY